MLNLITWDFLVALFPRKILLFLHKYHVLKYLKCEQKVMKNACTAHVYSMRISSTTIIMSIICNYKPGTFYIFYCKHSNHLNKIYVMELFYGTEISF